MRVLVVLAVVELVALVFSFSGDVNSLSSLFASIGRDFKVLGEWTSFSHADCNAILQARKIYIPNGYVPFKQPWERQPTILALIFIAVWCLLAGGMSWLAWRPGNGRTMIAERIFAPIFLFVGLRFGFQSLFDGRLQYVETCRTLLAK